MDVLGEWSFKTIAILGGRKGQNQVLRQSGVKRVSEVLRHYPFWEEEKD